MQELHAYTFVSWAHIASALLAMVLGPWSLVRTKGDLVHRRIGYAYVAAMIALNGSAFGLYRLFGTFGPFHAAALVSLLTLLAGIRAMLRRPRREAWLVNHLTFMYWSVIGLYAAFFSELMVRLPFGTTFVWAVGTATGGVILVGFLFQGRLTARWVKEREASLVP